MRPYPLIIPPGETVDILAPGNYLRVKTSPVVLLVQCRETGESAELEEGDAIDLTPFERLSISHSDAAEQTVKVYIGRGTRMVSSKVGGSIGISGTVAVQEQNPVARNGAYTQGRATVLTGAVSTLLAANAARRAAMIQNNSAADYVRFTLDGSAPTAAQGFRLAPGGFYEVPAFAVTGAIKAIAETGAGASVEFAEG